MNIESLRSEFAVFEDRAYLNAGTNGPVPTRGVEAVRTQLELEHRLGRSGPTHWARLDELAATIRAGLAGLLGASTTEVALTRSTTDGVDTVLRGLDFSSGDVILTSDQEHAGLLGPLAGVARRYGVEIRRAPFDRIADHVDSAVKLVAVSHVSWMTGAIAPIEALATTTPPLLVDGAQALGAIPVDVQALGCDFYAGSGQKWLCGPSNSGALYVRGDWTERLGVPNPRYVTLDEQSDPLELIGRPGATRFDSGELPGPTAAWLAASLELLSSVGWDHVHDAAIGSAARLRDRLADRVEVVPGDATTLVSFAVTEDPTAKAAELDRAGVVVRSVPGRPWLRASFGAWNDDADVERLVDAL